VASCKHFFFYRNDAASGNLGGYFADTNTDDDASIEEEEDDEDGDSDEDQSATAAAAAAAAVVAVPEWRQSLPTDGYLPTVLLLLQMDQVMIRAVCTTWLFCHGRLLTARQSCWVHLCALGAIGTTHSPG
jgi:hypothetical protein